VTRAYRRRVRKIEDAVRAIPVRGDVALAAYEHFRATGELPDEPRVAATVVRHCKRGHAPRDYADEAEEIRAVMQAAWNKTCNDDEVMNALYDEAVWAPEPLRLAARQVLVALAKSGHDPSTAVFERIGSKVELPEYGSVGMMLLGFPDRLIRPPYELQAARLLNRYDDLRPRIKQDDRCWFDRLADATGAFHERGDLPDEPLLLEAVLAGAELQALFDHAAGDDVGERMAAFAACDVEDPTARSDALARLRKLVAVSASPL
jgi:hypothetical protein